LGPALAGPKAIWVLHRTGLLARRSGLQTLPRESADPRLAGCRPFLVNLQTPGSRLGKPRAMCLHARTSTSPSARWLQLGA